MGQIVFPILPHKEIKICYTLIITWITNSFQSKNLWTRKVSKLNKLKLSKAAGYVKTIFLNETVIGIKYSQLLRKKLFLFRSWSLANPHDWMEKEWISWELKYSMPCNSRACIEALRELYSVIDSGSGKNDTSLSSLGAGFLIFMSNFVSVLELKWLGGAFEGSCSSITCQIHTASNANIKEQLAVVPRYWSFKFPIRGRWIAYCTG